MKESILRQFWSGFKFISAVIIIGIFIGWLFGAIPVFTASKKYEICRDKCMYNINQKGYPEL